MDMVQGIDLRDVTWKKGWKDLPEAHLKLRVPSVTRIIGDLVPDPDLEKWIEEVGEEQAEKITQAAQHRGNALHIFIEEFLKEMKRTKDPTASLLHTQKEGMRILQEMEVPEDKINKGRDMFYDFYESEHARNMSDLVGTEVPLYSPLNFFRGIADVLYKETGYGLVATDLKSASSYIKKGSKKEEKYKLQVGGYALALDDLNRDKGGKVKKSSIVCVNTKSSNVQEIWCEGEKLEEQKEKFKTLCRKWHKNNNQGFLFGE